jgi:hypothetical protein
MKIGSVAPDKVVVRLASEYGNGLLSECRQVCERGWSLLDFWILSDFVFYSYIPNTTYERY